MTYGNISKEICQAILFFSMIEALPLLELIMFLPMIVDLHQSTLKRLFWMLLEQSRFACFCGVGPIIRIFSANGIKQGSAGKSIELMETLTISDEQTNPR